MKQIARIFIYYIAGICLRNSAYIKVFTNSTNHWHVFRGAFFGNKRLHFVFKDVKQFVNDQIKPSYGHIALLYICLCQPACRQVEVIDQFTSPAKTPLSDCNTPECIQGTRLSPPRKPPTPTPQGLPIPVFAQLDSSIAYGTKVTVSANDMPLGATIEYSYDNGKSWATGNQVLIVSKGSILARTRINELVSAVAQASYKPYFQRMLVIGNSIMSHGPAPELGWYNTNGMAASAPEKDFVHLLTGHLAGLYPQVSVRLQSGGNFERGFGLSSYSIDEFNEPLQQFKPDLIVVRIGENVDEGEVIGSRNFEKQFRSLLERLAAYGQPVKIVCTTSVWPRPQTDIAIRKVTKEKGYPLADLSEMVPQSKYFASQYADPGVAAHPNDLGMQRIADLIWPLIP